MSRTGGVRRLEGLVGLNPLPTSGPGWMEDVMADDEANIQECVRAGVALFVELRMYLPSIVPIVPEVASEWFQRVLPAQLRDGEQGGSAWGPVPHLDSDALGPDPKIGTR